MTQWMYLSFADAERFRGGAFVPGGDVIEAVRNTFRMGINPGSDTSVMGMPIPEDDEPPAKWRGRLLTRAELDEFDREMEARA